MKLLIIGGSDAGISAALRARELNPSVQVTVALADDFPNFSICGLPFFLSGETPDWTQLAHRTEFDGIVLLRNHRATAIDRRAKRVFLCTSQGTKLDIPYDKLVIATGAEPATPAISGLRTPGVYSLHTMEDSFEVKRHLEEQKPHTAVIVGAGYIGVEMADALKLRGLDVTLVGRNKAVLATVDEELGEMVDEELRHHGVAVVNDTEVRSIRPLGGKLIVASDSGFQHAADLVLVAAGVKPSSNLALGAGLAVNKQGAIRVDRSMRTHDEHIFAAGDCVETWHRILGRNTYLPLGTTSHKQGRVAGENAVGGHCEFQGSVGTQVVKVFELAVGRTGLREAEAVKAGFKPLTTEVTAWDHKAYYPGAKQLRIRVTGDRETGLLLGAQIVGHWQSQVAKRIDVFAAALHLGIAVEEINDLDLSYTPPLSSPWDPVQLASQAWAAEVRVEKNSSAKSSVG